MSTEPLHKTGQLARSWKNLKVALGRCLRGFFCLAGICAFLVMPTASQGLPLPQTPALQDKFCYSVAVQRLSQALVFLVFFSPDKSAHILDFHSNISEWLSRNSTAVYNRRKINPSAI